ncbi:DUF4114 domain-containing protein [Kordiimonas sp. SCSIO 12603]|uniref:DUF4114 domain-containing protein n=1 Tax=Kordiimonas sp. SCSIO 12603 TaxID=2829596 RepID=UPI002107C7E8|nr:DUF4114 domain-containing protein [Kordiimonas sp. SCSIO 12603]UTW60187.1 DUF4114 domain-containing protein [Kordiimonas sp. SCSIO 12603]
MKNSSKILIATLLGTFLSGASFAGTVSPVQSSARPFGLEPIGDVQLKGSDAAAADFVANDLSNLQAIVNNTLTESQSIGDVSSIALDPSDLFLSETSSVRSYFIGEGAGYRNSLGVYTGDSSDGLNGDASLILPDASTSGYYSYLNSDYRSSSYPVAPGDFVDLGEFEAGTQLNLFLIANGASGGTTTYFTDMALNPDDIDHFVVLATPNSPYLLVGVEDLLGGGDEDYNDVVVALDVGTVNASKMIANAVPLPGPVAALLGPLFLLGFAKLRRKKTTDEMAVCA